MGVMEGRDLKHIRARFEDIYRPTLLANWKIWPVAQVSSTYVFTSGTLLTGGCDSLSILGLCPCPIVFHFNKPVAYSGHSIYPSSTLRELHFFLIIICCSRDMRQYRESRKQDEEDTLRRTFEQLP